MNYYPFHLGDYAAHTAHLEPMEDLAYRRMLDAYYLREGPLPSEPAEVARLIRLKANVAEVAAVLSEFFRLTPAGWEHARCEEQIGKFRAMAEGGKRGASKRWGTPEQRAADSPPIAPPSPGDTGGDAPPKHPPMPTKTNNQNQNQKTQHGKTNDGNARTRKSAAHDPPGVPEGVEGQTWADWCAHRKAKRATVSATVLDHARREAAKAGLTLDAFLRVWVARGSQGLQAEWLTPGERGGGGGGSAAATRYAGAAAAIFEGATHV